MWGDAHRRAGLMATVAAVAAVATVAAALAAAWPAGAVAGVAGAAGAVDGASPIGAHSMLQLSDPPSFMRAMFEQAAAMGASSIRLDVAPAMVFGAPSAAPDFSGLDEVIALSSEYHLNVVADLLTIPSWLADCQPSPAPVDPERCGTDDLTDYGSVIGQIVTHADPVIQDWEVWNEPDSSQFFTGTPAQYAWMLRTAHDAIKQVDPRDQVLLGGISGVAGTSWLAQVFAVPGADAQQAFDIANLHERNRLDALAGDVTGFRQFLAGYGFSGPLWITEHGYPSDAAFQYDPGYATGPAAQATYLTASLPTLLDAGAAEVFVTERDNLGGQFASEGVLGGDVADPPPADPQVIEKPAYAAVAAVAGCYAALGRDCASSAPAAAPSSVSITTARLRSSATATVTISDPGGEPLALGAVDLTASAAVPIAVAQDGCSHQLLEPDERCAVGLRFAPAASGGGFTAALQVPSDQGTLTVAVTATVPSVSALAPAAATFRPVSGGDGAGYPQLLRLSLTNPLTVPVRISRAGLSGSGASVRRFAVIADDCAAITLAAGSTCRLDVLWDPTAPGTRRAVLTVRGDGDPLAIALRATASALPAITRLAAGRVCLNASQPSVSVRATVSQPAVVRWSLQRERHPLDPRCQAGPRARSGMTAAPSGWIASRRSAPARPAGWTKTTSRAGRDTTRFPVAPSADGRPARPGAYLLTVTASNAHGRGRARTLWLTVAAPRRAGGSE